MARFSRPNFGSISVGLTPDKHARALVDTFVYELRQQNPIHQTDRELLRTIEEAGTAFAVEKSFIPELIHSLSRYAPKGYHFGPSDTDPTDFGYWPDESTERNEGSIETAERHRAEETIAAQTAEEQIAHQWQQQ